MLTALNMNELFSLFQHLSENDEATVDDTTKKTLWTIDGSGVGTTDVPFLMEVFTQTMKGKADVFVIRLKIIGLTGRLLGNAVCIGFIFECFSCPTKPM